MVKRQSTSHYFWRISYMSNRWIPAIQLPIIIKEKHPKENISLSSLHLSAMSNSIMNSAYVTQNLPSFCWQNHFLSFRQHTSFQRCNWYFLLRWRLKGHWTTSASCPDFFFKSWDFYTMLRSVCLYAVTACFILLATSNWLQGYLNFSCSSHF